MRLFIGVEVPEELKQKLLSVQQRLESLADIKLVEPENLHFSLKFLGEVNEDRVNKIREVLTTTAEKFSSFTLTLKGIGAFPSTDFARIIWAGCSAGSKELEALAGFIDLELSKAGFSAEQRSFTAHLTLSRIKQSEKNLTLQKFISQNTNLEFGSMKVPKISLIKSTLTPAGPAYEEIFSVGLKE